MVFVVYKTPHTALLDGSKPTDTWQYHSPQGNHIGTVIRIDFPELSEDGGKSKVYRPVFKFHDGWSVCFPDGPRAIYRLDKVLDALSNGDDIWIFEGEKCCDFAAKELGLCATTCPGGVKSAAQSDWSTLATAKRVFIVPDCGYDEFSEAVASEIKKSEPDAEIRVVTLDGIDRGDDIVEWMEPRSQADS